jgi:hypothetical protein
VEEYAPVDMGKCDLSWLLCEGETPAAPEVICTANLENRFLAVQAEPALAEPAPLLGGASAAAVRWEYAAEEYAPVQAVGPVPPALHGVSPGVLSWLLCGEETPAASELIRTVNLETRFFGWDLGAASEALDAEPPAVRASIERTQRVRTSDSVSSPSTSDVDGVGGTAAPAALMPTPPHLPGTFAVGAKVVLVGLERLAHLNGTVGVVAGYFSSSLRHSVKLDGLKVSVRPCNMRALQSQAVGASAGIADACQGGFSLAPDGGVKQPPVAVSPLLGVPAPADDIEFLTTCSSDTALPEDKAAAALSVVTCSGSHISAPANVGADVVTWSVSSLRAALQDRGLSVNGKKPALLRRLGTALALCSGSKTRIRMGDTRA